MIAFITGSLAQGKCDGQSARLLACFGIVVTTESVASRIAGCRRENEFMPCPPQGKLKVAVEALKAVEAVLNDDAFYCGVIGVQPYKQDYETFIMVREALAQIGLPEKEGKMGKLIPLSMWAKRRYETPPSSKTLRRWAENGNIVPRPQKNGRAYFVPENAQVIDSTSPNYLEDVAEAFNEPPPQ